MGPTMDCASAPVSLLFRELIATPMGAMAMLTDEDGKLRALDWEDHHERMMRLLRLYVSPEARIVESAAEAPARRYLEAYFAGELAALEGLEALVTATPFQQAVWQSLRRIPAGQMMSYGALAQKIGRPSAVRAVGLAAGANPIAIVIPCHRLIGANRRLTGYAGGLWRKQWLLDHEQAVLPDGRAPGRAASPAIILSSKSGEVRRFGAIA